MNNHTMIARGLRRSLLAGGLGLGILLAAGGPAAAQTAPSTYGSTGGGTTTGGATQTRPAPQASSATQVRGVTQTRGTNQLPVTGSDVAGLAAVGAGLLAVGAVAVKSSRRTPVGA